jgi:hypothetical protein
MSRRGVWVEPTGRSEARSATAHSERSTITPPLHSTFDWSNRIGCDPQTGRLLRAEITRSRHAGSSSSGASFRRQLTSQFATCCASER